MQQLSLKLSIYLPDWSSGGTRLPVGWQAGNNTVKSHIAGDATWLRDGFSDNSLCQEIHGYAKNGNKRRSDKSRKCLGSSRLCHPWATLHTHVLNVTANVLHNLLAIISALIQGDQ